MARNASLACLGLILAACCLAQTPVPTEKATISGTVTSTSGQPIRRAIVRLTPAANWPGRNLEQPDPSTATETDSAGNFVFDNVAAGSYTLSAEHAGYLKGLYDTGHGPLMKVNAGEQLSSIHVPMIPQGIIAGRVFDDENEPLPGAMVNVERLLPGQKVPLMLTVGRQTTNADGAFAIGELIPGRYVVSVSAEHNGPPLQSARGASRPEVFVRTFYPDSTDPGEATPIELSEGAQVRGLEIRLQRVPVFKVSGKVVNAVTGEPASVDGISLIRQGTRTPGLFTQTTGLKASEFSFDGVLPGNYALEIKKPDENPTSIVGWQTISVGNSDLDRVMVEMKPGVEMTGKIVFEGAPAQSLPQITLTPTEGLNYPDFANIGDDGRFVLTGLEPASYQVNISGVSRPAFVKAIRFNGSDLISSGTVDLTSASSASMEIVISDRATASISGVVTDSGAQPQSGAIVLAIPRQQQTPAAPFRMPLTDVEGRYSIQGLVPGDYILAAIQAGQMLAPPPPDALEKLGKMVTLAEDKTVTVDLQLVTMDELRALVPH